MIVRKFPRPSFRYIDSRDSRQASGTASTIHKCIHTPRGAMTVHDTSSSPALRREESCASRHFVCSKQVRANWSRSVYRTASNLSSWSPPGQAIFVSCPGSVEGIDRSNSEAQRETVWTLSPTLSRYDWSSARATSPPDSFAAITSAVAVSFALGKPHTRRSFPAAPAAQRELRREELSKWPKPISHKPS